MRIVMTLVAAAAAGYLFDRFDVPGGTIIGAMVGAAAYSLISGGAEVTLPGPAVSAAYVVIGAVIGSSITRPVVREMRHVALPAVLSAAALIVVGLVIAVALHWAGIAPDGVILATSPGALSAMAAVASEQGNGVPVAIFHTVRVVLVLLSLPLLLRLPGG